MFNLFMFVINLFSLKKKLMWFIILFVVPFFSYAKEITALETAIQKEYYEIIVSETNGTIKKY